MVVSFDAVQWRVTVIPSAGYPEVVEANVSEAFFFSVLQQFRRLGTLHLDRNLPALDLGAVEAVALKQEQAYKRKSRVANLKFKEDYNVIYYASYLSQMCTI